MTHSVVPATRPANAPANNRFLIGIGVGALVSLGAVGASRSMTTAIGSIRTPASSGAYPSTFWRYCVITNIEPNIAK